MITSAAAVATMIDVAAATVVGCLHGQVLTSNDTFTQVLTKTRFVSSSLYSGERLYIGCCRYSLN